MMLSTLQGKGRLQGTGPSSPNVYRAQDEKTCSSPVSNLLPTLQKTSFKDEYTKAQRGE